mgnify:CR=1 FL=1
MKKIKNSYKKSGVNISVANKLVDHISKISKKNVKKTDKTISSENIGAFGSSFDISKINIKDPVIVSCTDGVGTKIDLANRFKKFDTIGIDLVAMCVNDIITCGAKPLYFLDYISTKKLDGDIADIMVGILKGCEIAEMNLLGGETAEHPQYQMKIDLAGFCTGIVEQKDIIDGKSIKPSDRVIGLASSGLHSNGYSIVNYLARRLKLNYCNYPELLTPTTIYAPVVKKLLKEVEDIYGMSHITGGGIPENLPRCLPKGLKVNIDWNSWTVPDIFLEIQRQGNMDMDEMKRVFNLGIGYCVVLPANRVEYAMDIIRNDGIDCWEIGEVYA